jgi:serine/threonine protein kinase
MLKRQSLLAPPELSHWKEHKFAVHHPGIHPLSTNEVIITDTITKDYDNKTGNKIINHYMIIKEIGRGVHGKVKLAQDMNTGHYVVSGY